MNNKIKKFPDHKHCPMCNKECPRLDFYIDPNSEDGLYTVCMDCESDSYRGMPDGGRICTECLRIHHDSDFYEDPHGKGRGSNCIHCTEQKIQKAAGTERGLDGVRPCHCCGTLLMESDFTDDAVDGTDSPTYCNLCSDIYPLKYGDSIQRDQFQEQVGQRNQEIHSITMMNVLLAMPQLAKDLEEAVSKARKDLGQANQLECNTSSI